MSGLRPILAACRHLLIARRLAIVLLAAACTDSPVTPRPSHVSSALPASHQLTDAAHGGRAGFFFLPPMVKQPVFAGSSDASQSPLVLVCEWGTANGAAPRCLTIVAQFSMAGGTASESVRYDATSQQYVVNWKVDQCLTGPCTLDPAKTYRLRVLVGALELGHADVAVVANGGQAKNAQTSDVITLVNGRTLPVKFRIEKGAVSVVQPGAPAAVDAKGGAIATSDGLVALDIPAGALGSSTPITIATPADAPLGASSWSNAVNLGPDGTTFAAPITLTLAVDPSKLPLGVPVSALRIFQSTPEGGIELPGVEIDETRNSVSAPIEHFSEYWIGIGPNAANWTPNWYTITVGQTLTLTANAGWNYVAPSGTYCYWQSTGWFGSGYYYCYTTYQSYSYPARFQEVVWDSFNAGGGPPILSLASSSTFTDFNGNATSPPVSALLPGQANLRATSSNASTQTPITVLGQLQLLPKRATVVAGWAYPLQLSQTVATANSVDAVVIGSGSMIITDAAGQVHNGGHYAIPAGGTATALTMYELQALRTDTIIASTAGYVADTAVVTVRDGTIQIAGWPTSLAFGDSAFLMLTPADERGTLNTGNVLPTRFSLASSAGLAFSDGQRPITDVAVAGQQGSFWVTAVGTGRQSVTITNPGYLPYTNSVVTKAAGNGPLYVTNHAGFAVTAYSPTANGDAAPVITIEGSRTALSHPSGIGFDGAGNLYVTSYGDYGSNIVAFAPGANGDATPVRVIGGANTGLAGPQQVLFDRADQLYVPNYLANNVLIFARGANGDVAPGAVIGGSNTGLSGPNAAAFDATGRLYIANAEGHSITIYAPGSSGNVSPVAILAGPNSGIDWPSGVVFDAAGRLYVTNYNRNSIGVFAPGATGDATPLYTIGGPSTGLAQPVGLVFDVTGRLWVSNFTNSDVIVFAAGATGDASPVIRIAGSRTAINHPSRIVFGPPR